MTAARRAGAVAAGLGALGVLLSAAGAVATWSEGPVFGPHWYALALVPGALPLAWLGGRVEQLLPRRHTPHPGAPR